MSIVERSASVSYSRSGMFRISELKLAIPNLPSELVGYRMVQLSDLHYGACTSLSHITRAIQITNDISPNLVLLTGDYVQYGATGIRHKLCTNVSPQLFRWYQYRRMVRELARLLAPIISKLQPADGVFGVVGNHDYLEGIGTIYRQFPETINWLRNSAAIVNKSNSRLVISGLDDIKHGKPDLEKTIDAFAPNKDGLSQVNICLSHNPDITIMQGSEKLHVADLILSGHTHGGQIRLPYFKPPITRTKQWQHVAGLSFHNNTPVYVTNGIGYGTISLRVFCPPEITVITLVAKGEICKL